MKVALELLPEGDKRDLIAKDVREMESLTGVLLEMERVRSWTDRSEGTVVELVALVREVAARFEQQSPGVEFIDPEEPIVLRADEALLGVLIQNLVDNAGKFSLPDSRPVVVRLRSISDRIELIIEDDGRGIPEAERESGFWSRSSSLIQPEVIGQAMAWG